MKKTPFADFKKLISKTKTVSIITHVNPDGDAMGSSLGLYHYLKNKGKNVKVILPNKFPDFLAWMPASKQAMIFEGNDMAENQPYLDNLIKIVKDCKLTRTGDRYMFAAWDKQKQDFYFDIYVE